MKRFILLFLMIIPLFFIYSKSQDAGIQQLDSLFKPGILNERQIYLLRAKCRDFIVSHNYSELSLNKITGEIEIMDTLVFPDPDKKVIFQRCRQWILINYGDLIYSDFESGKIIANGLIDLDHFADYQVGFTSRKIRQIQTPTNYTLILTFKDSKIKYNITNINYTFTNFSETINEVSAPVLSLFPLQSQDQLQWIRYISVINASVDKFYFSLKKSLVDYINDAANDYNF
jgi:hypothetical protein